MPADIPYDAFRIWTHPNTSDDLPDILNWPYILVIKANEWLDIIEEAQKREDAKIRQEIARANGKR